MRVASISNLHLFIKRINPSRCYKYVSQATNFLAAEKSCNSMGGSLVSVSNAFENSYIDGMASVSSPAPSYWIGANLLVSARWSWTNGDNSSYQNWAPGQPSDPSIYQCGAVRDVDNQWTWETFLPGLFNRIVLERSSAVLPSPTCARLTPTRLLLMAVRRLPLLRLL